MKSEFKFLVFSALLFYGLLLTIMLLVPSRVRGTELPLKEIVQNLPLPEVGGTAQLEVRKKHWRLFQPPKWQYDDMVKQGLDPRWRYGPIHYFEIRFITKPNKLEWKK